MTKNAAVVAELNAARRLVEEMDFEQASPALESVFEKIYKSHFFPLLEHVLALKLSVDKNTNNNEALFIDLMLRVSPYISSSVALRLRELDAYTRDFMNDPVEIIFPKQYLNLLPFKTEIRYSAQTVVCGNNVSMIVTFHSLLSEPFSLSELLVGVKCADGSVRIDSFGSLELNPKQSLRLTKEIAVSCSEEIAFVTYRINKISYKVNDLNSTVRVQARPDDSISRFDIIPAPLFFCGATIPFSAKITAERERIQNSMFAVRVTKGDGVEINVTGKCGDVAITENAFCSLGDIEIGESKDIELSIVASQPVTCSLDFDLNFDCASGKAELHQALPITFEKPYSISTNFFDTEMHPINSKTQADALIVENSITNCVDTEMTLEEIVPSFEQLGASDLPVVLSPGEQYSFLGKISSNEKQTVKIKYLSGTAVRGQYSYRFSCGTIANRSFTASLSHPSIIARNTEFEAVLLLTNKTDDLLTLIIATSYSSEFVFEGPKVMNIPLFPLQEKSVTLRMVPLRPGNAFMPQVSVGLVGDKSPKIFTPSIIVTY